MPANEFEVEYHFRDVRKMVSWKLERDATVKKYLIVQNRGKQTESGKIQLSEIFG